MSIFGIITVCFLICFFIGFIIMLFTDCYCNLKLRIGVSMVLFLLFITSVFVGIGFNTEGEKVFVKKFLAQKQTIEMSLNFEDLTGFERLKLVERATELNGEFAERKAQFELWHFVVYDNTIYDNVELISLKEIFYEKEKCK